MNLESIESVVRARDAEQLRNIPEADLEAFLVSLFTESDDSNNPPDFDRLMSLGILTARSGHEEADRPAIRWLLIGPSDKRMDIVCAFLNGLWNRPYRKGPVSGKRLEQLVAARRGINLDASTEYSYAQALSQVMRSDVDETIKEIARAELERIAKQTFQPPLDSLMASLIERAL